MNAVIKVVEKVNAPVGEKLVFNEVLMLDDKVGNPYVSNATVTGEVVKHGKQKKLVIFKYKNKNKSSRRKQGHRQPYTKIKIVKIG